MILADKLIRLRRQAGWSQEELAEQLGVTRQSVSKGEGAQSVPDLDKVVQMSRLFGVTTDYLLKDELETPQSSAAEADTPLPRLTEAEAARYLDLRRTAAPRMALGTLLCVLSPVCLILLAGMSDLWPNRVPANLATGIGMCVLLGMVAAAVALFLSCGTAERDFAFLDGSFVMDRGAAAMVQEARQRFAPTQARLNTVATLLCILSVLPLFASLCILGDSLLSIGAMCLLLVLAGCGCFLFVYAGTVRAGFDRLLQEGDYAAHRKGRRALNSTVSVVYWMVVTAVFFLYTFGPNGNGQPQSSWVIWAVGGVLYGAVVCVLRLLEQRK